MRKHTASVNDVTYFFYTAYIRRIAAAPFIASYFPFFHHKKLNVSDNRGDGFQIIKCVSLRYLNS